MNKSPSPSALQKARIGAASVLGFPRWLKIPMVGDIDNPSRDVAVIDFQVWYWVTNELTRVDPLPLVQRRLDATEVTATGGWGAINGGWAAVTAVEVCLHLRGAKTGYPSGTFTNCAGNSTSTGERLHQVFRGTYKVRNAIL